MKHWLWLSVIVLLLDQASKWLVMTYLAEGQVVQVLPNLHLTLQFNPGAAFSLFEDAGGWQRWALAGFALLVIALLGLWLGRLRAGERLLAAALALVIGGALGNLIDRVWLGHVVDFVQVSLPFIPLALFNPWPLFNLADSAITVGAALLVIESLRGGRPAPAVG